LRYGSKTDLGTIASAPKPNVYTVSDGHSFIEFFAGIGLVHEALAPSGWACALANDNDPKKVDAYLRNYPDTRVVLGDVRDLDVSALPRASLATASFPCIDLSQAGGRTGINGHHSGIVWSFLEHIESLAQAGKAPDYLLLENVPGLLTLHGGASIDLLLRQIAELGYAFDLVQVDARHFTPQARNRVFIIAVRDIDMATSGEMPDCHIRRYKVRHVYERNRHLPWVFFDFPKLPDRSISLADVLVDLDEDDPRWWDDERTSYFWSHLERDHAPRLRALAESHQDTQLTAVRRGRRRGLREQIFNLRFDGLASCLRTPKGGSSIQFVVQAREGRVQVRRILGIESARLQGVALPELSPDFRIPEGEHRALYAFGDAVCVPAVRWVMEHSIDAIRLGRRAIAQPQPRLDLWTAG
jgi:DNA (cytosine-5)-methyltransferase 1